MDRATRYGIVCSGNNHGDRPPIRNQRTNGRRIPPTHLQMQPATLSGASLKADVGRRFPQMTWFVNIKMLLWRLVDKMDGE